MKQVVLRLVKRLSFALLLVVWLILLIDGRIGNIFHLEEEKLIWNTRYLPDQQDLKSELNHEELYNATTSSQNQPTISSVEPKHQELENTPPQQQQQVVCHPHLHFVFARTYKTGSSTVRHVVQRYAVNHGRRHDLMVSELYAGVGGYPGYIKKEFLFVNAGGRLRPINSSDDFVIVDHFRYNYSALLEFMHKDTRYFSILRKPWRNFQSAYYFHYRPFLPFTVQKPHCYKYPYFHFAKGKSLTFEEYVQLDFDSVNESIPWYFRSRNYQAFHLGIDPFLDDGIELDKAIKTLDSQFDLIMITEYMDESMILLKDLLCMSWSDIVYSNIKVSNCYTPIYFDEDDPVMKRFNKLYKLDIALYDHFNRTFWKKVDAYGRQRMMEDVSKLRLLTPQYNVPRPSSTNKRNRMVYDDLIINFTHHSMAEVLKRKMSKYNHQVVHDWPKETDALVDYTVENGGGCPFVE